MEPILEKIDIAPNQSFAMREFTKSCQEYIWHFHSEFELTYIQKGSGMRYMAGKLENFKPGDLVLIGKNIPHYYINNQDEQNDIDVRVIHFDESIMGGALFSAPEFIGVRTVLENANSGICFTGKTRIEVSERMKRIKSLRGLERIIALLDILNLLARSSEYYYVGIPGFKREVAKLSNRDFHRVNVIFDYIEENYQSPLSLKEMADLAHMTIPAFCRYFKKVSRKSFVSFLNEFRIGRACKLLVETDDSVANISLECGFNSIANFNRQFKLYNDTSPLKYKNSLLKVAEKHI